MKQKLFIKSLNLVAGVIIVKLLLAIVPLNAQQVSWYTKDFGFTSPEHKKYVKQIIWSKAEIPYNKVADSKLETRFKLTDPIYGRVFLEHSIRNTPVFSSGSKKPLENWKNSFEVKLFIDGKDAKGRFGIFYEAYYNDDMGKQWTTWQFSPHLLNPESTDEKEIAASWEKAVRGLSVGEHNIRFEFWGVMGQQRTAEPLSAGEFTLVVNKGERIAVGGKFPSDSYNGSGINEIRSAMKKAIVGPVAKSSSEVLKVSVSSNWKEGVYSDSKRRYRTINGTVLWSDKDNDGVCRYTSYVFISDQNGSGWSPLRYKGFCNGCPEGDAERP